MPRVTTSGRCAIGLLLGMLVGALPARGQQPPPYIERVEVARVIVDARVIDSRGNALEGLTAADFEVRIDGRPARVESVQWLSGTLRHAPLRQEFDGGPATMAPEGRLIVFLFQKSLHSSRAPGLMRTLLDLRGFLDALTPHDRIAVLSFDSHLRLWLDFTADVERVRQVLARNILFGGPSGVSAAPDGPSLLATLDPDRPKRTYQIESALRLVAEALEPLPGPKTLVLVGYGFGRLGATGMTMENDYGPARDALRRARTSVFCLDITTADYHSLEAGLQLVAEDTGGFFERTHIFGKAALHRLGAAIAGHYVLLVEKPEGRRGVRRIDVRLVRHSGTVFARTTLVD